MLSKDTQAIIWANAYMKEWDEYYAEKMLRKAKEKFNDIPKNKSNLSRYDPEDTPF